MRVFYGPESFSAFPYSNRNSNDSTQSGNAASKNGDGAKCMRTDRESKASANGAKNKPNKSEEHPKGKVASSSSSETKEALANALKANTSHQTKEFKNDISRESESKQNSGETLKDAQQWNQNGARNSKQPTPTQSSPNATSPAGTATSPGTFKSLKDRETTPMATATRLALFVLCTPFTPFPPIETLQQHTEVLYKSKHKVDFSFISFDIK